MTTLTAVDVQEGQAWKAPILRNCVPNPPKGDTLLPDCQHYLCTQGYHQFCQTTTTHPSTTVPPSSTTATYATSTVKVTTTTAPKPSSTTGAPTTLSSSPTTTASATTTVCQEDQPCWDCQ